MTLYGIHYQKIYLLMLVSSMIKIYYLYIDDHVDTRTGVRITLYDGVGAKNFGIYGKQDNYHG